MMLLLAVPTLPVSPLGQIKIMLMFLALDLAVTTKVKEEKRELIHIQADCGNCSKVVAIHLRMKAGNFI